MLSKERPGLDEKSSLLHNSLFLGLPIPNRFICILQNSPPMILPGQKSLMIQEVWKHLLSLDCLKSLLPKILMTSKYCSQITLLLQERETDHSGSCKTDITKAPSRELQPHNIQLPIIYSVARFSAGINQGRFLAFNRVKLIYAS